MKKIKFKDWYNNKKNNPNYNQGYQNKKNKVSETENELINEEEQKGKTKKVHLKVKKAKTYNDLWYVKKNMPNYDQTQYEKLTSSEKAKVDKIKKRASKSGRYIEMWNQQNFYHITWADFLPLFLGMIYSLIKLFVAYGDAKRIINFNDKWLNDLKSNLVISLLYSMFLIPFILICLFVFFPYMVLNTSDVTYGWIAISNNGLSGFSTYMELAVEPLFDNDHLIITLLVWIFLGMANSQTFLFALLFRFKKKKLFEAQRNEIKLQIEKITQINEPKQI